MIHSPKGFCPRVPYAKQDSGRVQYWVIWSLGQRNKFISHPTTAIRQLTFGRSREGTVLSPALQRYFGIRLLARIIHKLSGIFSAAERRHSRSHRFQPVVE